MSLTTFQASAQLLDGTKVQTKARQHEFLIDEPASLGGTDKGMNPVEALLCSLGACQAIVARVYAEQHGIDLQGFRVELSGELDTDGFLCKSDVRPGYQRITYTTHVCTTSPKDKVEEFLHFIDQTCPICDTLVQGVQVESGGLVLEQP